MTMKKESAFDRIRARSPLSNKVFAAKALDIADQLAAVLAERGMSQRELAKLLGKGDSEVSKWLSGQHNPTLETIAKLEAALGVDLLVTRLNPDGYFNRRSLHKLPVAAGGGSHIIHSGNMAALPNSKRVVYAMNMHLPTSLNWAVVEQRMDNTPDTCLGNVKPVVDQGEHAYSLPA